MKKFLYLTTDEHYDRTPITYNKVIGITFRDYKVGDTFVKKLPLIISDDGVIIKEKVVLAVIDKREQFILVKVIKL